MIERVIAYLRLGGNAQDPEKTIEEIEGNISFRGTNLLILVFAILIASVGLNMNSAAVVIGAMLISPLMGPIVGVGAGLAILDLGMVNKALRNLGFAVGASVLTSTIYFLISPLHDAHSEILSRTSPTIWDVLIASAGGFAGITASASKDRGNVVPGVAIATALMPPLCTAGFGLAHGNWAYFAGAFYLFLINSVFISLAALVTLRWLRYPVRQHPDEVTARRIRRYTTIAVVATVLPSIYLAWRLVGENTFRSRAQRFIALETAMPDNYLLESGVDADGRIITLTYMGNGLSAEQLAQLHARMEVHGLDGDSLNVRTGLSLTELNNEELQRSLGLERQLSEQAELKARLTGIKDSLARREAFREELMREATALEPELRWLVMVDIPGQADSLPRVVSARFIHYPDTAQVARIDRWLDQKLNGWSHTLVIAADSLPRALVPPTKRRR